MAGRGRGMALFQKLIDMEVEDDDEEQQQQLEQVDTQSISTVAPFPNPRGRGTAYGHPPFIDISESERSPSEVPASTESFVLPGRGRGMFAARLPGMMGAVPAKSSEPTEPLAEKDSLSSNPIIFGRGRGAINSSGMKIIQIPAKFTNFWLPGRGSGSESSKDKVKSIEDTMVEKLKIVEDEEGAGDAKVPLKSASPEATNKAMSRLPVEPVLRHGVKGEKFNAITNSMFLKSIKEYGMFEYDVRFEPVLDSMQIRKTYLRKMGDEIGTILNYDGADTLYLPVKLPSQVTKKLVEDTNIKITFRRQRSSEECLHFYNVLFDRIMRVLNFERIGRKFFDPVAPKMIPQHKLQGEF